MSTRNLTTLSEARQDLTRRIILDAAISILENGSVAGLTVRAVAKQANISERTIFRYLPSRDDFLDAVAQEVRARQNLPAPPDSLATLYAYPRTLYSAYEASSQLTKAALHSEIYERMRETAAKARWAGAKRIIDAIAPMKSDQDKTMALANIGFFLSATAWRFYRSNYGLSLEETITCVETAIRQIIDGLCHED